jgi:sugar phosphate isomerase/epimerase
VNVDNWRHADKPIDYCFAAIVREGIEYTELEAVNGDEFFEGLGFAPFVSLNSDPIDLRKKLDRYGLKASQLDVSFPINRWECIDFIRRGIIFAGLAGIPCVDTTDGAVKLPGLSDKEQLGIIKYHLAQCVSVAENHKVILNVEPHGPFTTNPEMLLEIVEHFASPYVQINFDTGNSFISGQDPDKFLEQVLKYVNHVHCKDVSHELAAAARGKETGISASVVPIGQGANADNIAKCIARLKRHNWDGVFSIESDGEENVEASIGWLRRQIASSASAGTQ